MCCIGSVIMDYNIVITNNDGTQEEVEVLNIFNVNGYDNKEYILYTKNKEIDNDNIEVFISILRQQGDNFSLENIEDEKEWDDVQKAIDEMGDIDE